MDHFYSRSFEITCNHRHTITRSLAVHSHRDIPDWWPGDRQSYLPYQEHLAPPTNGTTHAPGHASDLTDREVQVLYWVASGKTDPEIGRLMDISEFTVKNHMKHIFKKLDVVARAQAVDKYNAFLVND
ncbi:MAG: helix-turn-helix transcriptional regulator [Rhodoferax sp.]|uniref:response regulator transcription factor n=1 Tax=Rhodoferax sp. TaxID=50421 RepID=UPI00261A53D6|nr:helix-turn-helix transcriptional regulator [Rhodoferax sp.]MDD2879408.1 helix-turn-helix transcriptional regulator [Rhodoferax sp.]